MSRVQSHPGRCGGEVSFADVSFSYEPDRPVLEHVSFRVRAGEVAAFVGGDRRGQDHPGQPADPGL